MQCAFLGPASRYDPSAGGEGSPNHTRPHGYQIVVDKEEGFRTAHPLAAAVISFRVNLVIMMSSIIFVSYCFIPRCEDPIVYVYKYGDDNAENFTLPIPFQVGYVVIIFTADKINIRLLVHSSTRITHGV